MVVIEDGWTEIADMPAVLAVAPYDSLYDKVVNQEWVNLSQNLEDAGIIAPNTVISDARIINAAGDIKMWYKP